MNLTETMDGAVCVLSLSGRLDGLTSPAVSTKLSEVLRHSQGRRIVLDCAQLEYVSSAGLRVFIQAAKQLKAAGGMLAVSSLHGAVREVFDISGFSSIFQLYGDRDEAVAALR